MVGKRRSMTKWELGQDLIFIQDTICDKYPEILKHHPECAKRLHQIKLDVGDLFQKYNDHSFSILDRIKKTKSED